MRPITLVSLLLCLLSGTVTGHAQSGAPRTLPPAEKTFVQALAQTHAVPLDHATALLSQARVNARVRTLIQPAQGKTRRSWPAYRQRFVSRLHIDQGLAFWQRHRAVLDAASAQTGVPASIIVAIIGVETLYGGNTGKFSVLNALYTLAFHHPEPARPERVRLFREQLADLIELDHAGVLDARRSRGSFAGAVGLPQFLPGSIKRFARDGDGDGRIDLLNSPADAIASVANFLREHGWQAGLPVFTPVTLPESADALATRGLVATLDWQDLQAAGARSQDTEAAWQQHRLGVIGLVDEVADTVEYRTVTPNFYALTQYNRSYFYAAAVADLAQALEIKGGIQGIP